MAREPQVASVRGLGLSDDAFQQRRPLAGQITKREVRAVSLYSMGLRPNDVVWDIGAGTGSISVEAACIAHRGRVYAIERDAESLPLLRVNLDNWSPGNVEIVDGEAPECLMGLDDPDVVFVGGSGGHLDEILDTAMYRVRAEGRIVVNLAAMERTQETYRKFKNSGFKADLVMVNSARGKEMPDGAVRFESLNPVFIVTARREV